MKRRNYFTLQINQENKKRQENYEKFLCQMLIFICISMSAVVGVFVRIGISYYRIWLIDTNYVRERDYLRYLFIYLLVYFLISLSSIFISIPFIDLFFIYFYLLSNFILYSVNLLFNYLIIKLIFYSVLCIHN